MPDFRVPDIPRARRRAVFAVVPAVVLAFALAACAAGSGSRAPINDPSAGTVVTTRIEGGGSGAAEVRAVNTGPASSEAAVSAPPDKVFLALPAVYERLGVPVNTALSDGRILGARDARMPRRIGKAPLSQYVECGSNATGMPNADSYAVTMTVLSRVTPAAGGGSTVVTQVAATARPITVSGNPIQCGSTGRLEQAINDAVVAEAAR